MVVSAFDTEKNERVAIKKCSNIFNDVLDARKVREKDKNKSQGKTNKNKALRPLLISLRSLHIIYYNEKDVNLLVFDCFRLSLDHKKKCDVFSGFLFDLGYTYKPKMCELLAKCRWLVRSVL